MKGKRLYLVVFAFVIVIVTLESSLPPSLPVDGQEQPIQRKNIHVSMCRVTAIIEGKTINAIGVVAIESGYGDVWVLSQSKNFLRENYHWELVSYKSEILLYIWKE